MKHEQVREMISAYFDHELSGDLKNNVDQHLGECSECRHILEEYRSVSHTIKHLEGHPLPAGFSHQVLRAIRNQEEESESWVPAEVFARKWVAALSMIVVIFFIATLFTEPENPVIIESYLTSDLNGSSSSVLLQQEPLTKDDILLAVVTK